MSLWITLSGPTRRAVNAAPTRTRLIVLQARRTIAQSRPLGRGDDWVSRPTKSSSSSPYSSQTKRSSQESPTLAKGRFGSKSGSTSDHYSQFPDARSNMRSSMSPRTNATSKTDRFSKRVVAATSTGAAAVAVAAATVAGAAHTLRRHNVGARPSRRKDDSSDDDDDEEWLDRKRRPKVSMWPRGGVEAVDDEDDNEDRSTLSRGRRSYDSDHGNDDEDEDDEDPEYERTYAHKRSTMITKGKDPDAEYLYHPNAALPALTSRYRKIHRLYIINSYNRERHPDIKKCIDAAASLGIHPIKVDRHTLNMMSENRPHAGVVLEVGELPRIILESLGAVEGGHYDANLKATSKQAMTSLIQQQEQHFQHNKDEPPVWIVMDEVMDPQNMGAIMRSAFFLGADGVVVCSKNSAPFSPVVSKASSGAMEARRTFSVQSLVKFLQKSKDNGWQVVGAHVAYGNKRTIQFHQWPETGVDKPTILIMGNEGSGLRKMILKQCDHYIQIPTLSPCDGVVDSLNVGTATGVILSRFMGARFMHLPKNPRKYRFRAQQNSERGQEEEQEEDDNDDNGHADVRDDNAEGREDSTVHMEGETAKDKASVIQETYTAKSDA